MSTDSLLLRRTFDAPRATVFEAWRNPEIMARWFTSPGWVAAVASDFRVGGSYRIQMSNDTGVLHVQTGEYLEIEPDVRLVFSWTCKEIGVVQSVVTVELEARGSGTDMTLVHTLPSDDELIRLHTEGWVRCLTQLDTVLDEITTEGSTR